MKLYITSRILSKEMLPQLIYFIFYSNVKHLFKNLIFPEIKMKYRQFYLFFVYKIFKKYLVRLLNSDAKKVRIY